MGGPDEIALLARLRQGDEAAFIALVERLHGPLRRLARSFVSTDASADEVVQDTWVAVLAGLDRFEGRSSLRTWISTILVNRAKTRGVREGRTLPFSALDDGSADGDDGGALADRFGPGGRWATPPAAWSEATPARLLEDRQAMALIDAELRRMPERQRVIVLLRDTLEWSAEEVCNALAISETNQRVLLHRARTRLRASLAAHLERSP